MNKLSFRCYKQFFKLVLSKTLNKKDRPLFRELLFCSLRRCPVLNTERKEEALGKGCEKITFIIYIINS